MDQWWWFPKTNKSVKYSKRNQQFSSRTDQTLSENKTTVESLMYKISLQAMALMKNQKANNLTLISRNINNNLRLKNSRKQLSSESFNEADFILIYSIILIYSMWYYILLYFLLIYVDFKKWKNHELFHWFSE